MEEECKRKRKLSSTTDEKATEIDSMRPQFQTIDSDHGIIPHFPQEITVEILSRLPVKSLLKFRCVSKLWLSWISSADFIKTHLQKSTKNKSGTNQRIIFTMTHGKDDLTHLTRDLHDCSLHSLLYNPVNDAVNLDYPMKCESTSVLVVGTCNGLVCMAINGKDLLLWNPATRNYKKLPDSGVERKYGSFFRYGFGFDELNDDYKVVEIFNGNAELVEEIVMVYRLKTNSWKRIENFGKSLPYSCIGEFANQKLYWYRRHRWDCFGWKWFVISLDIDTEMYETVEMPNGSDEFDLSLGTLDRCLCVFDGGWPQADLWVLKEHGLNQSWTKVVSIPLTFDPDKHKELNHYTC